MTSTATYNPAVERHPEGYPAGTSTPWGPAQFAYKYGPGIINYSCAGHGGFHLAPRQNSRVDPRWRRDDGWYEEDCEFAMAVLSNPEHFHADYLAAAHSSAKCWFPHEYEAVMGVSVTPEESIVLRDEIFAEAHKADWVTVAAYGEWADWVPKGWTGVCAVLGGNPYYSGDEKRYFLVPAGRYKARQGTYVIDLDTDLPADPDRKVADTPAPELQRWADDGGPA